MTGLDYGRFDALTFDCYGTLIDWNGGSGRALERVFGAAPAARLLHRYRELEPVVEREQPGASYRRVLDVTLARLAGRSEQEVMTFMTIPSTISGGPSIFQVRIGSGEVMSAGDEADDRADPVAHLDVPADVVHASLLVYC